MEPTELLIRVRTIGERDRALAAHEPLPHRDAGPAASSVVILLLVVLGVGTAAMFFAAVCSASGNLHEPFACDLAGRNGMSSRAQLGPQ